MIVVREQGEFPDVSHHDKIIRATGGKVMMFDSPKLRKAKEFWYQLFCKYAPEVPLEGPLAVYLELRWPHNKSARKGDKGRELPKFTHPDLSNIYKTIEDAMAQAGFFKNDSMVCDLQIKKFYSPEPGIYLRVGQVEL